MSVGLLQVADPADVRTEILGLAIRSQHRGKGQRVIVLHHSFGNPGWLDLYEQLAQEHEVIVPDLPGFGLSDRPEWARDVRDLAILIGMWVDRIGSVPVAVVGMGFGGWIAAELATMAPHRVSHLVLVGAAGILPRHGRIADQMLVSHTKYLRDAFFADDAYEAAFGAEPSDELLETLDINREMVARVAWKPYMYNRRLEALLPEVDASALIVWGEHDRTVPLECGERYAELLSDARLEIISDAGHAIDFERPSELARAIQQHLAGTPVAGRGETCS